LDDRILWVTVVNVAIVAVFVYGFYRDRRRDADLRRRAIELGLRFLGTTRDSARILEEQGPFALLRNGYGRSVRDVMRGERGGYDITVFDYGAATRDGGGGGRDWRTVVRVASPSLRLPAFTLEWQSWRGDPLRRPEDTEELIEQHSLYAVVRDALACVPFDHHPRFSHDYKVRGNDDAAIAATFVEAVLAFFEKNPGWNIESVGDRLLLDRGVFTVQPARLEAFLDEVIGLVRLLEGKR
jgi:hypothetical protein